MTPDTAKQAFLLASEAEQIAATITLVQTALDNNWAISSLVTTSPDGLSSQNVIPAPVTGETAQTSLQFVLTQYQAQLAGINAALEAM